MYYLLFSACSVYCTIVASVLYGILLFVQVLDNLTPLIEAHEDLVQDLKNFVEGKPFNLYATEPIINHK